MRAGILTAAILGTVLTTFAGPALAQYYPYPYPPAPRYYPGPQPYYAPPPPAYPVSPRVDKRRVANYCETAVGTCETPGPMYVGRGCNCYFPGYGKTPGYAAQAGY